MEASNIIEEDEIEKTIKELHILTEKIENSFNNMNSLINDCIANGIGIWDGNSANSFKASWEQTAENFPEYIKMINTQASNLETIKNSTITASEEV